MTNLADPSLPDPVEKIARARRKYTKSEKGKESLRKYRCSEKGKEAQKRYLKSEKGRQAQLRYYYSPKGLAWRKKQAEVQKFLRKATNWIETHPGKTVDDFYTMVSQDAKKERSRKSERSRKV